MKKEQILLLTNKFVGYYDNGMKYYFLPEDIVDNNNKFKFDILCVQINKIIKNLSSRKFYLFYVDPKFSIFEPRTYEEHEAILNINTNEELDNFLYQKVDTEEYDGRAYSFNDTVNILLKDRFNNDILSNVVEELKQKIYICDLFEPLSSFAKSKKFTGSMMFFFEDLYFYYIFKSGKFISFSYKDRYVKNEDDDTLNLKSSHVMSDLGVLISSIGHMRDDLKTDERADFILFSKLTNNETVQEYLKTLSFNSYKSIDDVNSFLSSNMSNNPIVSFNKTLDSKNEFKINPYYFYVVLSIILLGLSVYKYINSNNILMDLDSSLMATNERYNNLINKSNALTENDEKIKVVKDELNEIKSSYNFLKLDSIDKVYKALNEKGTITNIEVNNDFVIVSIISDEELNMKNFDVISKFIKDDKIHYTMRYKND